MYHYISTSPWQLQVKKTELSTIRSVNFAKNGYFRLTGIGLKRIIVKRMKMTKLLLDRGGGQLEKDLSTKEKTTFERAWLSCQNE